jgi:hypothetical protein
MEFEPLKLEVLAEKGKDGSPVFLVDGMKFYYEGIASNGDKVWQNREADRPEQIVMIGDTNFEETGPKPRLRLQSGFLLVMKLVLH